LCWRCQKATFPIVCERTTLPHYSSWSYIEMLAKLEKHEFGMLQPEGAAQGRYWREKDARGQIWFEWPS
jgi:hypothetical protein